MFDLKVINSVLTEMEEERGIGRERMLDAIEQALATAYKKEYGRRGQIVRAKFDMDTGSTIFEQVKTVVDDTLVRFEEEGAEEEEEEETRPTPKHKEAEKESEEGEEAVLPRFDPERHITLENARLIKKDAEPGEELIFPLEPKDDFGRIAAQTAKQVIIQKIREAEKESALTEFGQKEGEIVIGHVQRFERGNLYIDLGRVPGIMPYDEQIPGERFKPGDRIRVLILKVEETARGVFIKLSRSHPDFLEKLFEVEAPELQSNAVEVKAIAREAGSRSKIAIYANDDHIDPVGSLVGQRGVRVSTVMSELGGEKIDIIEWSEDPIEFIEDALSPAQVLSVTITGDENPEEDERGRATVEVAPDQQSLAIGRGGQNVRLAAKLTGWKIDIVSAKTGDQLAEAGAAGDVDLTAPVETEAGAEADTLENEDATTVKPEGEGGDEPTGDRDMPEGTTETDPVDTPEEAEEAVDDAAEAAQTEEGAEESEKGPEDVADDTETKEGSDDNAEDDTKAEETTEKKK